MYRQLKKCMELLIEGKKFGIFGLVMCAKEILNKEKHIFQCKPSAMLDI